MKSIRDDYIFTAYHLTTHKGDIGDDFLAIILMDDVCASEILLFVFLCVSSNERLEGRIFRIATLDCGKIVGGVEGAQPKFRYARHQWTSAYPS